MRSTLPACTVFALVAFLGSPLLAQADTYQYSVTDIHGVNFSFTTSSLASSGSIASGFSVVTVPGAGILTGFGWNSASGGDCSAPPYPAGTVSFAGDACAAYAANSGGQFGYGNPFTVGSFLNPGTYVSLDSNMTVTITDLTTSAVPEPSGLLLFATGLLTLAAMTWRKTLFA